MDVSSYTMQIDDIMKRVTTIAITCISISIMTYFRETHQLLFMIVLLLMMWFEVGRMYEMERIRRLLIVHYTSEDDSDYQRKKRRAEEDIDQN